MKEIMFFYIPKEGFTGHPPHPLPNYAGLVRAETYEEASDIIERNCPPNHQIGDSEITENQNAIFKLQNYEPIQLV